MSLCVVLALAGEDRLQGAPSPTSPRASRCVPRSNMRGDGRCDCVSDGHNLFGWFRRRHPVGAQHVAFLAGSQEIHIDEKTISPHLSLSEDKKTLTFSPKKGKVNLDCPERFDHWPNALATLAFRSGICAWKVSVEQSCAYKLGVCYSSVPRKGSANEGRLGFNAASWVFSRYDKEFRFLHAGQPRAVELLKAPAEIGVLVDFAGGEVLFYDPDSCAILFSHRENFTEPLYPVFAVAHQSISLVQ